MTWLHSQRGLNMEPAAAALPLRFAGAKFEKIELNGCRDVAERYLTQFWDVAPQGIAPVLLGRTQTWKTYTAAYVARRLIEVAHLPVAFVSCPAEVALLDRFRDEDQHKIRKWMKVAFLVLDDFAALKTDSYGAEVVRALASGRFDSLHPTLWTGNIDAHPDEVFAKLAAGFGSITARRIQDGGRGFTALVL
jgi:DNA replication protein DnaC